MNKKNPEEILNSLLGKLPEHTMVSHHHSKWFGYRCSTISRDRRPLGNEQLTELVRLVPIYSDDDFVSGFCVINELPNSNFLAWQIRDILDREGLSGHSIIRGAA